MRHYTTSDEYIVEFHFLKINIVIPLLEIVYGLLSLVVMVITKKILELVNVKMKFLKLFV